MLITEGSYVTFVYYLGAKVTYINKYYVNITFDIINAKN